jgi:hypothetical protein
VFFTDRRASGFGDTSMNLPVRALILGIAAVHALAVGRLDGQQTRCPPLDSTAAMGTGEPVLEQ